MGENLFGRAPQNLVGSARVLDVVGATFILCQYRPVGLGKDPFCSQFIPRCSQFVLDNSVLDQIRGLTQRPVTLIPVLYGGGFGGTIIYL